MCFIVENKVDDFDENKIEKGDNDAHSKKRDDCNIAGIERMEKNRTINGNTGSAAVFRQDGGITRMQLES